MNYERYGIGVVRINIPQDESNSVINIVRICTDILGKKDHSQS